MDKTMKPGVIFGCKFSPAALVTKKQKILRENLLTTRSLPEV